MNPVIKKKVMETLNTSLLSREDILTVTELNLNNLELTDISDLSEFKNLIKLELNDNYLNDLKNIDITKNNICINKEFVKINFDFEEYMLGMTHLSQMRKK